MFNYLNLWVVVLFAKLICLYCYNVIIIIIIGISPLFLAARGGHLELVKALVRYGSNVNQLGAPQKIGPLHWAAHKEHVEIALFLIENGAEILKVDGEGRTPLSMASPELADKMIGKRMT